MLYLLYSIYVKQLLPAFIQDSPIFPKKKKKSATTLGEEMRGEKEKDTPQETSCYLTV